LVDDRGKLLGICRRIVIIVISRRDFAEFFDRDRNYFAIAPGIHWQSCPEMVIDYFLDRGSERHLGANMNRQVQ
jgi:hypothetical protein